jgi:hypothetical protein
VGQTYGSAGDPLYTHIASATMINNGGQATALDQNNNVSNDQFTTDIGAGVQTFTFDASVIYNATVTYADGTTGTVTMVLAQSTAGHLFLAPEPAAASAPDTAVYEAKPIVSVTLNSITGGTIAYLGLGIDRTVTGFDDGFVEGTAGNDLIDSAYVEPIANGSDRIDNGDGVSGAATGWQDDRVRAGAGNDTVLSGLGNDFVDGGTGADSIDGGDGADSLFGGTGAFNDTIQGGAGNDTIDGGDGNDSLLGGAGSDSILGGLGADYVDGGTEADFIDGGDGNDSLFGGAGTFNDTIIGGAGNDTIDGGAGADTLTGGANDDRFIGITAGDVVDGSEDAGNTDTDVLDLFGSGWTKANTNIIFSDPSHENGTVQFLDVNGTVIGTMTFSNIETIVPCFTPGTLIDTDRGSLPVEALRPGDRVLTMDHGYQPVRWTGHRNVTAEELLRAPQLRPILISRDTFGPGLPERDLRVSPQHRLLLSGARAELVSGETEVLAPAVHLLGLPGVVQDAAAAGVRYIHILFDQHEIVRSDGLWTESFQPARAMLSGMDGAALTELLTLFPRLGGADHEDYPCARSTIKRHEARLILAS